MKTTTTMALRRFGVATVAGATLAAGLPALLSGAASAQDASSPGCASPSPTDTATTSATPTATMSASATPTASMSASATPTATTSATPTATATMSPSPCPTATVTQSATGTPEATATQSPTGTPEATATQSPTATPEATQTATGTPSATASTIPPGNGNPGGGGNVTPSPSVTVSPTGTTSPKATTSPTGTTSPTATRGPDGGNRPATPPGCARAAEAMLRNSTINATGRAGISVSSTPNSVVDLFAYTRPSTTFRVVRSGTTDNNGNITFADLRPPANTRLRPQQRGCAFGRDKVLNVRTQLSLNVVRNGKRNYTFSGRAIPARNGGLIVSLYRVTASGQQILTSQARANAATGQYVINRRFTGSGRFGFVVRTGQDLQNAPGASNVRSLLVF